MIILEQLTQAVGPFFKRRHILSSVTIQVPTDRRIALVATADEDKRTFIELLAGIQKPSSGSITRLVEVSFPVGQLPGFSRDHTVRLNVAHVARLYGADVAATVNLVEQVLDIGPGFDRPYEDFPRKQRRSLAQAVALALPFDFYLLTDDSLRPPQKERLRHSRTPEAAQLLFAARANTSGMIIPTNNAEYAHEVCDMGLVLRDGAVELYEDVNEAFNVANRRETPRRRRRNRVER